MKLEIFSQKKYCNNLALLHSPTNKRFFSGVGGIPYPPSFNEYIFLWKDIWITNFKIV